GDHAVVGHTAEGFALDGLPFDRGGGEFEHLRVTIHLEVEGLHGASLGDEGRFCIGVEDRRVVLQEELHTLLVHILHRVSRHVGMCAPAAAILAVDAVVLSFGGGRPGGGGGQCRETGSGDTGTGTGEEGSPA